MENREDLACLVGFQRTIEQTADVFGCTMRKRCATMRPLVSITGLGISAKGDLIAVCVSIKVLFHVSKIDVRAGWMTCTYNNLKRNLWQ